MRILTLTSLFPHPGHERHGIFVRNRLRHLRAEGEVEIKVVAPVPSFPLGRFVSDPHRASHGVPAREDRDGFDVRHPPAAIPPFAGMFLAEQALFRAGLRAARDLLAEGWDFDVIDAHYLYPDGAAAARISKVLDKPMIMTAHGTDVNILSGHWWAAKHIFAAIDQASRVVTVAEGLRSQLIQRGAAEEKVVVLTNGVDMSLFDIHRGPPPQIPLKGTGPLLLSVGNLVPSKAVDMAIEALGLLDGMRLLIVGDGPERGKLERKVGSLGLEGRVAFTGNIPHETLPQYYSAADILVFPTEREGAPGIVSESLACGTPLVASRIPATEEMLKDAPVARLVERTPEAFAAGVRELLAVRLNPEDVRAFAARYGWKPTSVGLKKLLADVIAEGSH